MTRVTGADLRRLLATRRRLVASVLAGLAVLSALSVLRPPPPRTVALLAAARDLPAGAALSLPDLASVAVPAALVPSGALRPGAPVLGRVVAGPVRRGEPLTNVRLLGPSLLAAVAPGTVAVPVRFADAGVAALLRAGDRIDVLAAPPDGSPEPSHPPPSSARAGPAPAAGGARVVAADVLVLAVGSRDGPDGADPSVGGSAGGSGGGGAAGLGGGAFGDGTLVVVACSPDVARALAAAGVADRLSPALRGGGP